MPNEVCSSISNKYTNTVLKTVTNVYQLQYKDFKPPGLGDYLRGCFCMTQLINILNKYTEAGVNFDMDLTNHQMAQFIDCSGRGRVDYKNIGNFHIDVLVVKDDENDIAFQHILRETINYFNRIRVDNFYTFCCKFAVFDTILEKDKQLILSKFSPNRVMESYIESFMNEFGIVAGGYKAIHIRCRDELSFPPITLSADLLAKIDGLLDKHIELDGKYLLISNHNDVKAHILSSRKNFIGKCLEICHIGQDTQQTNNQVRDTLLDYFLLSRSNEIIAFSPYGLSGFSLECSKLYNIPYTFIRY